MARTVRTAKVVVVQKVAAEHGSCCRPVILGASWMVVEAMGMSLDTRMFDNGPCMHHAQTMGGIKALQLM